MPLPAALMFMILLFILGIMIGRASAPIKIVTQNKWQEEADWWKRGEDPPEWEE